MKSCTLFTKNLVDHLKQSLHVDMYSSKVHNLSCICDEDAKPEESIRLEVEIPNFSGELQTITICIFNIAQSTTRIRTVIDVIWRIPGESLDNFTSGLATMIGYAAMNGSEVIDANPRTITVDYDYGTSCAVRSSVGIYSNVPLLWSETSEDEQYIDLHHLMEVPETPTLITDLLESVWYSDLLHSENFF